MKKQEKDISGHQSYGHPLLKPFHRALDKIDDYMIDKTLRRTFNDFLAPLEKRQGYDSSAIRRAVENAQRRS